MKNKIIILSSLLFIACNEASQEDASRINEVEFEEGNAKRQKDEKPDDAYSCMSQFDCDADSICFEIQYEGIDFKERTCEEVLTCDEDSDCDTGTSCTKAKVCIEDNVSVHNMEHLYWASKLMKTTLCSSDSECPTDRPICKIKEGETLGRCVKDNTSIKSMDPVVLTVY